MKYNLIIHLGLGNFQVEANLIRGILGSNCIEIYHIGSTSITNLAAKPIIDIMPVVNDLLEVNIAQLEEHGYRSYGELGIPFRHYLSNSESHIHIYEEGNPEIKKHLLFANYLKENKDEKMRYEDLKKELAGKFPEDRTAYCIAKAPFILNILQKAGFDDMTIFSPLTPYEWHMYHKIKKEQLFDRTDIKYDPNHECLYDTNNHHFVLYKGVEIVAIAQLEFPQYDKNLSILRALATDTSQQNKGHGKYLLVLMEKWSKYNGKSVVKLHAALPAEHFYRKFGYSDVEFNDPSPHRKEKVDLGKFLNSL